MDDGAVPRVRSECRIFTRYLAGIRADDTVIDAYARGLESAAFRDGPAQTRRDAMLLDMARRNSFAAGLADAWARFFAPAGQLRRRLVLLMAILESTTPGFEAFEPPPAGRVRAFAGLALTGFAFLFRLAIATLVIGPMHIAAGNGQVSGERPGREAE
jgi:hypothetical protein